MHVVWQQYILYLVSLKAKLSIGGLATDFAAQIPCHTETFPQCSAQLIFSLEILFSKFRDSYDV